MSRPFRVEIVEARRAAESSPMSHQVNHILRELYLMQSQAVQAPQGVPRQVEHAIALWSGVEDIQKSIDITKKEIGALHARNMREASKNRAADELRAVVTGTEQATDTILAAAETIDGLVLPMQQSADEEMRRAGHEVSNCVVQIFEACNFQDITGQRIAKVVDSLQFIEERIAAMVEVWHAQGLVLPEEKAEKTDKDLLNGPALASDRGVVNQDDVDALFS